MILRRFTPLISRTLTCSGPSYCWLSTTAVSVNFTIMRPIHTNDTNGSQINGAPKPPIDTNSAPNEEEELKKDYNAIVLFIKGVVAVTVFSFTIYYASKYARKRYFGDSDSVKVAVETRGKPSLGGPFTLVNCDGELVSQAHYLGKWTFFYFGFVHCPEICPIELNRMTHVMNAVKEKKPNVDIKPLFVSCDPKRDSLAAIKEYLSIFHKDFVGLVGTPNQVNDACKSYRIYYSLPDSLAQESGDYLIDHSIAIFLFDPQGRFVDFFGNRYTEDEITEKVLGYINKYETDPTWTSY
eukprot:Tbor_TRINITY_DN3597_c0_g1::TRINITY_DN3597_c0_g1_i1::g.2969::m.2969/K07152/SCO1_2; protein SCO1/2